jgi:hypothetical protein
MAAASAAWPAAPAPGVPGRVPTLCADVTRVATRTPGPGVDSVRTARAFTVATLRRWGIEDRSEDVVMVVSELLTNALRHAKPTAAAWPHPPVRLGLLQPGPCVMCAISDPSDQLPAPRQPDWLAESGRGLHVVASLSDDWGCTAPTRLGKIVWATFAAAPAW